MKGLTQISAYITHENLAVHKSHGSDAYGVCRKTGLDLDISQMTHDMNNHGRHSSIVKGKHASFADNINFAESFD